MQADDKSSADQPGHPLLGLLVAQFFGAFNDNAWKQIVIVLAIAAATSSIASDDPAYETATQKQVVLAQTVLILPLMLVSLPAALLADRVSKRSLIIAMKALELVLMIGATVVLFQQPEGGIWNLFILGMMGAQSALFSPAKYGILPEIVPHEKLTAANGVLEMWSNFAIIGGMVVGPALVWATSNGALVKSVGWFQEFPLVTMTLQWASVRVWLAALLLAGLSIVGLAASFLVPPVAATRTEGSTLGAFSQAWNALRADRILWLAFVGQILFWGIASLIPVAAFAYVSANLQLQTFMTGVPLAALGVGIGIGSLLAGKISSDKVEYGLLPLGCLGLSVISLAFGLIGPRTGGTIVAMAGLGIFSGFIIVPLNSLLQWRSPADNRGTVIALTNIFVFAGMLGGSAVGYVLAEMNISPQGTFVIISLALTGSFLWAFSLVPDAFMRFILFSLAHTIYRLKVLDRKNVPHSGGALLVPNHVSFIDGLLLIASVDRPIRFLVYAKFFERPLLGFFLRAIKAIPISSAGGPRMILRAFRDAGQYLDEGHLVCIFAEGQITRTGTLQPFQRGLQRIVKGRSAPIVPVYLDRAIGSIFALTRRRLLPQKLPYPVTVAFGNPMSSETPIPEVRQAVVELGGLAWSHRLDEAKTLHRLFVRRCHQHPFRMVFADILKGEQGGIRSLAGVIALAAKLKTPWEGQSRVGIVLPPSVGGAMVNIAVSLAGRTSVNLNHTAGSAGMQSAARQADLRSVVTTRQYLEKAKIKLPENLEVIWLEDVASTIGWKDRVASFLLALFGPIRLLENYAGNLAPQTPDDPATIIFSSGSTGEPKGVQLSHFNITSNVEGVTQVFRVHPHDRVLAILPFFHSFGYMALWLAANEGLGSVFHMSPLDAPLIGALAENHRATILLATPTFLQLYMRRCTPAQFGSLRIVMAGAEKLPDRVRDAFEEHFGLRPLEGYGTTECAPVIAVSTMDERGPGFFQPGSRKGYVGQPLPGIVARIVDPETGVTLPADTPGMLYVQGPNVMTGYLHNQELTDKVLRDGWYETGDIAEMDGDGFLKITGRLSRFSKIGGEMVPHGKVEEALHLAANLTIQTFAVTAVADEKKGERLVVLHTLKAERIPEIVGKLSTLGLPNLFIPKAEQFFAVEHLPVLGTGKLDLRELNRMAEELAGKEAA